MRKNLIVWMFGILLAFGAFKAMADVTILDNSGTQLGRVEKIKITGGTTTRSGQQATVNFSSLANVNWSSVTGIRSTSINWTDLQVGAQNMNGVNWSIMNPSSAGINWSVAANSAQTRNIVCWRSDGQLGKCATSVSGVLCTACN